MTADKPIRVRAVDLAANNVGFPIDVLDAGPPAVLGVVITPATAQVA